MPFEQLYPKSHEMSMFFIFASEYSYPKESFCHVFRNEILLLIKEIAFFDTASFVNTL